MLPNAVKFTLLRDESILPEPATRGSSGYDCHALLEGTSIDVYPGDTHLIPLGFSLRIPHGYEGQLRSRSGISYKKGLIVLNSPGTIDSDYTGEVKALMHNSSKFVQTIINGERVCQLVISAIEAPAWTWFNDSMLERGSKGFGSTDI